MSRKLMAAGVLITFLGGCTSDGQLTPKAQIFFTNIVTASCQVDKAIPGIVQTGGLIAALVAPEYAPELELMVKVDQLAHPAVVAACNAIAAASKPVDVTITPVAGTVTVVQ